MNYLSPSRNAMKSRLATLAVCSFLLAKIFAEGIPHILWNVTGVVLSLVAAIWLLVLRTRGGARRP